MSNERDTHFQGFAKLVVQDIANSDELLTDIIARRAYDLVYFLLDKAPYHSGSFDTGWGSPEEIHETIERLPDLGAWPEPRTE